MKAGLAVSAALLLIFGTCYGGVSKAPGGIEFTYYDPAAFSVSLAGDFNNWDTNANPMVKDDEGMWRVVVQLSPGEYEYKFVVNGGTWMADPDNPRVVGDYGNSGLTINDEGEPVSAEAKGIQLISNTPVNSRVLLTGWYRGTFATRKNVLGDVRWRFVRPRHEMYVSVNPTVGSNVKGSGTILIDSGVGDIREITADFYSGWLDFQSSMFGVTGYFNEELISFDDPLHSVGHINLPGTIWKDDIDYGRGTQGLILDLPVGPTTSQAFYSNTYDKNIYDNPLRWWYGADVNGVVDFHSMDRYDNTGTGTLGVRTKLDLALATFGVTFKSERNNWWVGFEGDNVTDSYIDRYRERTGDYESSWFQAGTSRWELGGDVHVSPLTGVSLAAEGAATSYSNGWVGANRVRKQGAQLVDGSIDVPFGNEDGFRFKVAVKADKDDYGAAVSYEIDSFSGMGPEDIYITAEQIPFEDVGSRLWPYYGPPLLEDSTYVRTYTDVNGVDEFYIYEFKPLPDRRSDRALIDLWARIREIDCGIQFGILDSEWKDPVSSTTSANTFVRLLPYLKGKLFGDRMSYQLAYLSTGNNLNGRMPSKFDRGELILKGDVGMTDDWSVYFNFRRASYDWTDDGKAMSENFLNPHAALVWSPMPNVEIRLGWGVNPLYYVDTPIEGREIGRERWRTSYLWVNPHASLVTAEEEMENVRMVSLMGVISF
jgi:hypothetical protein